jgi:hypothetical protein
LQQFSICSPISIKRLSAWQYINEENAEKFKARFGGRRNTGSSRHCRPTHNEPQSQNIRFSERRLHSLRDQPEQPSQGVSLLSLRASIVTVESEKQVPITDAGQERAQTPLVDSAPGHELAPQREWLIVVLDHRQHVGIVAELGKKSPRQRSVMLAAAIGAPDCASLLNVSWV